MAKIKQTYCTLYIVRHGETNANLNNIILGHSDSILNETGKLQAKKISQRLRNIKFDNAFSSDLSRTKETAEIIVLERKLMVETTKVLRERHWGSLEGRPTKMIDAIEELKNKLSMADRLKYKPIPDAESDEEVASRVLTFLREISVAYLGKTILVVSHAGVMRILLKHLGKKIPLGAVSNTGYAKLESDGVDFFIKETEGIKFDE